ncbi:MAG: DMT family transporter [Phycisphaeraceae bacterium]
MPQPQTLGIALGLMTAFFWAISPLCWASVGKRIGSFRVLLLRSALASALLLLVLPAYLVVIPAAAWPTTVQMLWIIVSGFLGMGIGDALCYEAFATLGPRRTTQILTLAPVGAVIMGWMIGEHLEALHVLGIVVVLAATAWAVLARQHATLQEDAPARTGLASPSWNTVAPLSGNGGERRQNTVVHSNEPGHLTLIGIVLAVAGAACVGFGAVAGRQAFRMGELDPFIATVLRVSTSGLALWFVPLCRGQTAWVFAPLRDRRVARRMALGVVSGPILGMVCYVAALRLIEAGLVSTMSATSPLFILPMIMWRYHVRLPLAVVIAALLAAAGIAMIYLT